MSAVDVLTAHGMSNAADLVAAAKTTGVPLWVAAAFAQKESNGRNVYGHDVGGTFAGAGEVTEANFAEFYRLVVDEGRKSNGVGPMQITYRAYFPQAKAEGVRLWVPLDNFTFGLRIVARHLAGDYGVASLERAGTLYNAGNLTGGITAYGRDLAVKAAAWRSLLTQQEDPAMTYFTRAQWGARAPRKGNGVYNGPRGIAYHYNGPAMGIDPNAACNCAAKVRATQNFHMDSRGWADIAYDLVCCPHGNVYQGRLGTANGTGANGTTYANQNYMAVMALIGDGEPLGANLKRALLEGRQRCRNVGAGSEVTGHQAHQSTSCPGGPIMEWIRAGIPAPTDPTRPRLGDRGELVKVVQNLLNLHGYGLDVDGVFGPKTDIAVRDFQTRHGLDVDGIVGPATMAKLEVPPVVVVPDPPAPEPVPEPEPEPEPEPTPEPEPEPVPAATLDDVLDAVESLTTRLEQKGVI